MMRIDRRCQGDIRWSGGPENKGQAVRGAKSYFCY